MKTVYYTLTAGETIVEGECVASAAGGPERRLVRVRGRAAPAPSRRDNVIDLTEWKQAREIREAPEAPEAQTEEDAPMPPCRPVRASRRRVLMIGGEAAATLSVILTMVLLMLRIGAM